LTSQPCRGQHDGVISKVRGQPNGEAGLVATPYVPPPPAQENGASAEKGAPRLLTGT
jgi:hypothetical protein